MDGVPRKGELGYSVKELSEAGVASVPKNFVQSESAQEAFTPYNETHPGGVPVIDLSGLQEGPVNRNATLAAITSACQEWGFFQVVNYGISPSLVEKTHKLAREFFDLPAEEKEALAKDPTNRVGNGYGRQFLLSANSTEDWQDVFFHYLLPPALKQIDTWPRKPVAYRNGSSHWAQVEDLASFEQQRWSVSCARSCAMQRDDGEVRRRSAEVDREVVGRVRRASGIGAGILAGSVRRHHVECSAELLCRVSGAAASAGVAGALGSERDDSAGAGPGGRPAGEEGPALGERCPCSWCSCCQPR